MKEIINPYSKGPSAGSAKSSTQGPLFLSAVPLPPPMGCCPKCGFSGELACFFVLLAMAVSSEPLQPTLVEAENPSSSTAVQAYRGGGRGVLFQRLNSSIGGTRVYARRKSPFKGVRGVLSRRGRFLMLHPLMRC